MKLNLDGINLDQFLKNNPQFHKKDQTVILTDGKNEIEVSFSQTQEKNIYVPSTEIVEKTQQEKVNEALRLHGLWLQNKKGGKQISPENYPKDFLKGMDLRCANLKRANLCESDLSYTDLTGADLTFSNLEGTNFKNAYIYAINLTNCIINGNTKGISQKLISSWRIKVL